MLTAGGILAITAGAVGLLIAIGYSLQLASSSYLWDDHLQQAILWAIAFFALGALAALAVMGGILALRREQYRLALAGTACGILCPPFLFGILATAFISVSRSEFKKRASPWQEPG